MNAHHAVSTNTHRNIIIILHIKKKKKKKISPTVHPGPIVVVSVAKHI